MTEKYVRARCLKAFNTDGYNEPPLSRFHHEGAIVDVPESRVGYLISLKCIRVIDEAPPVAKAEAPAADGRGKEKKRDGGGRFVRKG